MLIKINRLSAWALLFGVIIYLITGFAMTTGFIDSVKATQLHSGFLVYILLAAFIIHGSYGMRIAFIRWKIWNGAMKILMALFFIILSIFVLFLDLVYEKPINTITSESQVPINFQTNNNAVKIFTLQELAQYNGKNGNPSYVAVDGNVYDLTKVFANGFHFSHVAGTELTNAFYSKHAKQALSGYEVVGQLVKN